MNDRADYQVLVWERDGKYYGGIRELGILETSTDIAVLWGQIEERKQELIRKFVEGGIEDELPPPLATKNTWARYRSVTREDAPDADAGGGIGGNGVRSYVAKAVIAVTGILVCTLVASQYLEAAVHKLTSKRIVVREVLQDFAANLETLPEVKRESLHRSLQVIASNLRPFVQDLRPLLSDSSSSPCSDSCGGQSLGAVKAPGQGRGR